MDNFKTVYHGSIEVVDSVDINKCNWRNDFGKGFYLTDNFKQAVDWAKIKQGRKIEESNFRLTEEDIKAIVNIYMLKEHDLHLLFSVINFDSYNEDWLDLIKNCRSGNDFYTYDAIYGCIADDKVNRTVNDFLDGKLNTRQALELLTFNDRKFQICLRNPKTFELLTFRRYEIV